MHDEFRKILLELDSRIRKPLLETFIKNLYQKLLGREHFFLKLESKSLQQSKKLSQASQGVLKTTFELLHFHEITLLKKPISLWYENMK